jgi:transcriptional antiterminator
MQERCVLSNRQRRLLSFLDSRHGIVPGREAAEQLEVSTRTVRQIVSELNEILDERAIRVISMPAKGYLLEVRDRKQFHELISDHDHIRTREDRISYLMRVLLEADDYIPLADLEERLFVSRTTLENDLREVRHRIVENEPYIGLVRRHSSLLFEDDEQKRRDILVRMYLERWDFNSREGLAFRKGMLEPEILEGIRRQLRSMLDTSGIRLDDYGHIYMLLSTAVLYERILTGHPMTSFSGEYGQPEYEAVTGYLNTLNTEWEIELSEAEYRWLAASLTQLKWLRFEAADFPELSESADARSKEMLRELTGELAVKFGFDFSSDTVFLREMLQCVISFRMHQYASQMQNWFEMETLTAHYPFLEQPALELGKMLSGMTDCYVREEEALYLLPILASAAERKERTLRLKIRAVIVSHLSSALTGYLCENLRKLFGSRIEIVGAVPVYDRGRIREMAPSMIITTVQAESFRSYPVPTVVTSAGVTEKDLLRLDDCIQKLERQQLLMSREGQ